MCPLPLMRTYQRGYVEPMDVSGFKDDADAAICESSYRSRGHGRNSLRTSLQIRGGVSTEMGTELR